MFFNTLNIFGSRTAQSVRLPFATDIHCHVLPGVDHGAKDGEMACRLLEYQKKWGIERVFFTPHVTEDVYPNDNSTITGAFDRFTTDYRDQIPPMKELGYSAEYRLDANFITQLNDGKLLPLPGNHLLVELPFAVDPGQELVDSMIFQIQIKGFMPVLAHPERYLYLHSGNLAAYRRLYEKGIEFQINLLSLAGYNGPEAHKTALRLIDSGMVDYCATDLHHFRHTAAIDSYLSSRRSHATLKKLADLVKNDKL